MTAERRVERLERTTDPLPVDEVAGHEHLERQSIDDAPGAVRDVFRVRSGHGAQHKGIGEVLRVHRIAVVGSDVQQASP